MSYGWGTCVENFWEHGFVFGCLSAERKALTIGHE